MKGSEYGPWTGLIMIGMFVWVFMFLQACVICEGLYVKWFVEEVQVENIEVQVERRKTNSYEEAGEWNIYGVPAETLVRDSDEYLVRCEGEEFCVYLVNKEPWKYEFHGDPRIAFDSVNSVWYLFDGAEWVVINK